MLTFEQAYEFTKTIGSHTSFEEEECREYFDVLMLGLSLGSRIVEVGLEYGRSSSIALQVAKDRGYGYTGIDIAPKEEWFAKLSGLADSLGDRFSGNFGIKSKDVIINAPIDAILIDGDHSFEGVAADCVHFLPHVSIGGFALFHDYQRESLPEVTVAVNEYMDVNPHWRLQSVVGTLAIWRKQ